VKARIHQVVPRGSGVACYPHDGAWQVTLYARLRRPCSVQTWVWILDQVEDDGLWSAAVLADVVPVGLVGNGRGRANLKPPPAHPVATPAGTAEELGRSAAGAGRQAARGRACRGPARRPGAGGR